MSPHFISDITFSEDSTVERETDRRSSKRKCDMDGTYASEEGFGCMVYWRSSSGLRRLETVDVNRGFETVRFQGS